MEKLCRVCSSCGEYSIFAKIPIYLFANSNEFLAWDKTIAEILEETTGISVAKGDGFPEKMCALCISYLKHASSFREQVINNLVNLKTAQIISQKNTSLSDKESLLITSNDLECSDLRKTESNQLLNNQTNGGSTFTKIPLNHENSCYTKNHTNINKRNMELNKDEVLDEDPFTGSSDDNDAGSSDNKRKTFFNYAETNFEEEDILDVEELKGSTIVVNVPEYFKERKCRACSRRFMFEESYNEHLEVCIEYKFLVFIEESNRLFDIRRGKACSPHEFIRRMIFNLKKICYWLKNSCGENIILLNDVDVLKKQRLHSDEKSSEISSGENCITVVEKKKSEDSLIDILRKSAAKDKTLIRNFNNTPDPLLERLKYSSSERSFRTSTPLNTTPNSSYNEDERNLTKAIDLLKQRPKPCASAFQRIATTSSEEEEKENCMSSLPLTTTTQMKAPVFQKAQILPVSTTEPFAPVYPKIIFSAQCNQCNTKFSSIGELEDHNSKYHNKFSHENIDNHKKIIALFEDDDLTMGNNLNNGGTSKLDGIVDLF